MLPQDQEFLAHLKQTHGIDLSDRDLADLSEFHFRLKAETRSRLSEQAIEVPEVESGQGLGGLIGGNKNALNWIKRIG